MTVTAASRSIERIRRATRDEHRATEAAVGLLHAPITDASYGTFLRLTWGAMMPLERQLLASPLAAIAELDVRSRQRMPALAADLGAIGIAAHALAVTPVSPDLSTAARALGALYVVEGSTLGGAFLARRVGATLPAAPLRYLNGHGPATGAKWKALLAFMQAFLDARPGAESDVTSAARDTFAAVREWYATGA